jgi:hypothetical protein
MFSRGRDERCNCARTAYQRAVELEPGRTDLYPKIHALFEWQLETPRPKDQCRHCELPAAGSPLDLTEVPMEFFFGEGGLGGARRRVLTKGKGALLREAVKESAGQPWRTENAATYSGTLVVDALTAACRASYHIYRYPQ